MCRAPCEKGPKEEEGDIDPDDERNDGRIETL